jgi:glycosyltransferase involved in cell wall biosynthesis
LAPAASVADGTTAAAIFEIGILKSAGGDAALPEVFIEPVPRNSWSNLADGLPSVAVTAYSSGSFPALERRSFAVPRLAHFVQRYPPALGGSEAYFARLSRYLAARNNDVTVFTTTALDLEAFWRASGRELPAGESHEDGVRVRRYPLWRFPGRRYLLAGLRLFPHRTWQCLTMPCNPVAWQMWSDAGRAVPRFDLVHATAFPYAWPVVCARRLARRQGVPFLLTPFLHLGDLDDPRDPTRRAYTTPALLSLVHAADRVFVQTAPERDALIDRGIPSNRLVLLGMGVDTADCTGGNRARVRREWNLAPDTVVVGHLANNSVEKGTVDLLRAAETAWQRGHRFEVVLAGPQMPNFLRFWRSYASGARVRLLGPLTEDQKRDFFAGIDLFALPSRSDSFGIVLLEAWANGVPNVVYRAGGPAGVIRHDEDGLLVRCGDVGALADALAQLAGNETLRRTRGQTGLKRTRQEFDWQDRLDLVSQVYAEEMEKASRRRPGDGRFREADLERTETTSSPARPSAP